MKKFLQISILVLGLYTAAHIIYGLNFNPAISLVTRIIQALL
ncbi:hypothetical protein JOC74_001139 [Bacillus capparidis]|uniref:Uncharacterized protein n=1 Tax=Bacillus capparidis TaxID=1840411 RepID=A0ABS4CU18_9BACI|nr:hypothetical protein [Bacillus capparidis]